MNIKIGNYYLIESYNIEAIVSVTERCDGQESYWRCLIFDKEKHNVIKVRRKNFKAHLGCNLKDSLIKSPEYFI